ncbi:Protein of unknown function [Pyronema omphalodes CBS 100304]|uniref:Uncharacterized protein n=1 Tax=Pyronema omphalodes (strain CBS 100304) TaxID=1076935 RepID=U4L3E7_PYROM|nr:Protein of unknown function [Pyronema omphalodes CBS 100304]
MQCDRLYCCQHRPTFFLCTVRRLRTVCFGDPLVQ